MEQKKITLNETQLKQTISECVGNILKEWSGYNRRELIKKVNEAINAIYWELYDSYDVTHGESSSIKKYDDRYVVLKKAYDALTELLKKENRKFER